MKRYLNIASLLKLLVLALSGLAVSCVEEPEKENPEYNTSISFASDTVFVSEARGEGQIAYKLKDADPDFQVYAQSESGWLGEFDCSKNNMIKFSVDTNDTGAIRDAIVEVYYSEKHPAAEFVVRQSVHPDTQLPFSIELNEVTDMHLSYTVTPKDSELTYVVSSITKKMYDEQMQNDEVLYDRLVDLFTSTAARYGMTLEDFLTQSGQLRQGVHTLEANDLIPETEYYLIVVGMTATGDQLTDLYKKHVTTEAMAMLDVTFDMDYDIDGADVTISVTPSDNTVPYFFNALPKSDLDESGKALKEVSQEFIDELIYVYGLLYGIPAEEVVNALVSHGPDSDKVVVMAETEYVGYAHSLNPKGLINSDVYSKNFTSGSVPPSDNEITVSVDNINVDKADVHVRTSNDDSYVILVDPASNWKDKSDDELFNELNSSLPLGNFSHKGNLDQTAKNLTAETEYYVIVFGYHGGVRTTDVVRHAFTTATPGSSEDMTFEFKVSDIGYADVKVEVTGTPATALYFWNIAMEIQSEEEIRVGIDNLIEEYIGYGYFTSRAEFMQKMGARGEVEERIDGLAQGVSHKIYAVGVDQTTGEFVSDFVFSEPFSTLKPELGDAEISLNCDRYFDGNEVIEKYPEYARAADKVILKVVAEVKGNAKKYYYHIFGGDLTDAEKYPDGLIINNLVTINPNTVPEREIFCPYDEQLTAFGVAVDEKGNFGPVFRHTFMLTRDGVTPVDEFEPVNSGKSASVNSIKTKDSFRTIDIKSLKSETLPEADFTVTGVTKKPATLPFARDLSTDVFKIN